MKSHWSQNNRFKQDFSNQIGQNSEMKRKATEQGFKKCKQKRAEIHKNHSDQNQQNKSREQLGFVENQRRNIEQKLERMTDNIKDNVYEFVCSILKVFQERQNQDKVKNKDFGSKNQYLSQKYYDSQSFKIESQRVLQSRNKNKKCYCQAQNAQQNQIINSYELSQSNKNFILELFLKLGLLDFYKGIDRSFKKLVQQAQIYYYNNLHNLIQQNLWKNIRSKSSEPHKIKSTNKKRIQEKQKVKIPISKNYLEQQTLNQFYSMKKRLNQAKLKSYKIQQALQSQFATVINRNNEQSSSFDSQNSQKSQNKQKNPKGLNKKTNQKVFFSQIQLQPSLQINELTCYETTTSWRQQDNQEQNPKNNHFSQNQIHKMRFKQTEQQSILKDIKNQNSLSSQLYFKQSITNEYLTPQSQRDYKQSLGENNQIGQFDDMEKSAFLSPEIENHRQFIKIVSQWRNSLKKS